MGRTDLDIKYFQCL